MTTRLTPKDFDTKDDVRDWYRKSVLDAGGYMGTTCKAGTGGAWELEPPTAGCADEVFSLLHPATILATGNVLCSEPQQDYPWPTESWSYDQPHVQRWIADVFAPAV